jgi:ubiquinone/menaquinone biosynthesis C-methylase UbiE
VSFERDHWDELFDEIYLTTYAELVGEDAGPDALAAAAFAGVEAPAEILDAPTGFGRHSVPLAEAGYRVTGVDRSAVQLEEAHRRAGDSEWPKLVHADFRELPFEDGSFDAVLNLFSSIGYRGEDGDRQMLGEFLRVLRPGAALIVETMHRDRLMHIFQPRGWDPLPDEAMVAEERRLDHVAGEIQTDHILIKDGKRRQFTYTLRVYTATELVRMLEGGDFVEVEAFGDLEGGELTRESRLAIRARKPA